MAPRCYRGTTRGLRSFGVAVAVVVAVIVTVIFFIVVVTVVVFFLFFVFRFVSKNDIGD
jgi:type IV secretory pathway VirB3-like protein